MAAELAFEASDIVGESIVWDDRRGCLIWVDIIGRRIHRLNPATGVHDLWLTPTRVTSIGLREDGGAILGSERHICLWDWDGVPQPVCEVEPDLPENRLNEGVVGPDGAFWVGTMHNNINDDDSPKDIVSATGRIYRYTPDGKLNRVAEDCFGITNTLVFPAADRLFTADTLANTIYAYRIGEDGRLHDRTTLLQGFSRGLPDGSCLDSRGRLWTARVADGGCLTCITSDGKVEAVIDLPCSSPTSCAFGGPDLATLYVTSSRFGMSSSHLAQAPQEGSVFMVDAGINGLPNHRFGVRP